jgi:D-lyxose ketol-isomerase
MAAKRKTSEMLSKVGIVLTKNEEESIEIADFDLSKLEISRLQLVTYINTDRYCA